MNKTLKKIISVVLTLAMIVTSITIYNTTTKAEEEETVTIDVTASVVNNMINASWSQPDIEFATLAYFINYADDIQLDSKYWAKASNGWCWTQANPTEKRTALDTVSKSNDGSIDVANGGTYVLTVQYLDAEGDVVASGTSNAVTTEKVVNTDLNLKVERYEPGIAYLKWSLIGGAAKYEVYNADTNELMKTSDSLTTDWTNVTIKRGVTYNLVVKVINAAGEEIAITNNTATAYQEPEEETTKDPSEKPETAPDEHTKADFSNAAWIKLGVNSGDKYDDTKVPANSVENKYYINSDNKLDTTTWYSIYAPHRKAGYHDERTNCKIPDDVATFTFKQENVKSIWINGNKYGNPSTVFNCQGNCTEVSVEALTEEINVITLVLKDGTTNTFGIKVAAPLGIDATQEAAQDTIDPSTVAEWTQMGTGTTANGSKVFKDSSVTTSENGGMDGCYAANNSAKWNITDIMNSKAIFGVVRKNTETVIIDGVEYINATDARSTKVYIGSDCIYVDAALLDAPAGETQYHMITLTGGTPLTFIVKVEGPEAKKTYKVTLDGNVVAEGATEYKCGDNEQGYYDKTNKVAYVPKEEIKLDKDIELTSIKLNVKMRAGASIRLAAPTGLRFQTVITAENNDLDVLDSESVKTGTIITTSKILGEDGIIDDTFVKDDTKNKLNIENSGWYGNTTGTFCGSIVEINKSNYGTDFVGVGYVTIKYNNNTEKTIYASVETKGDNVRSASTVAKKVKESDAYKNKYTKAQKDVVDAYANGDAAN